MQSPENGNPQLPPGPKGRRIRNLLGRLRDFRGQMARFRKAYGDMVFYRLPGMNFCALFSADLIREVLVVKEAVFTPFLAREGWGIITSPCMPRDSGEHHRQVREIFGGAFAESRMHGYASVLAASVRETRDGLRAGQVIDYKEEMERLTVQALLDTILGREPRIRPEVAQEATWAIKRDWALDYLPGSSLLRRLPLPAKRRARRALQAMDQAVYGAMRRGRESSHAGEDMTSHVVRTADRQERCPFSGDRDIRDELYTLVIGSIDSTTSALVWGLDYLARNPAQRDRFEQEVDEVLGSRPLEGADFGRLRYTRAVFNEIVRLSPPSYASTSHWRQAQEDCRLGGHLIPKGTIVQTCIGELHRDPAHWEHADQFKPERWLQDAPPVHQEHAYIPFLSGPHRCLGWEWATMLVVLALAGLAQGRRLEPLASKPIKPDVLGIGVKGPVRVTVRERRSAA